MINGEKIVVVLPAYNAAKTLRQTYLEIDRSLVDEVILVDDASRDETAALAQRMGLRVLRHRNNLGYGGNQKTCYTAALECGADIVVTSKSDSGSGSLREALQNVSTGGTITFDAALNGQTILLTTLPLFVTKSVTITLVFRSATATLTGEHVEGAVQKVVTAAKERLNATVRM